MKLVSVTTALKPFNDFSHIPPETLRHAAERGTRIHAAIAAHLTGTFLVVPLPDDERPLLDSLRRWCDEMIADVYAVEPEVKHHGHGYCGHPDAIVMMKQGGDAVIDWKTPQVESLSWPVQISAYCVATDTSVGFAVQPQRDGRIATAKRYDFKPQHFNVFMSALNCYRYFNQNVELTGASRNGEVSG